MEYSKGSSALAISHTTQWHLQSNDGAFNLPKLVVCINMGGIERNFILRELIHWNMENEA